MTRAVLRGGGELVSFFAQDAAQIATYRKEFGEVKLARSQEMIANTAPFDVTGHPATSVPAGLADGLPVGMMIVGRHLADGTCLRVARAFENAVGGFPAPPGY